MPSGGYRGVLLWAADVCSQTAFAVLHSTVSFFQFYLYRNTPMLSVGLEALHSVNAAGCYQARGMLSSVPRSYFLYTSMF